MLKTYKNLRIWCVIGLLLSAYATYVEVKAEQDADYVAMCDLSEKVSCTAVFTSSYGKGFGLLQHFTGDLTPPNGVLGIMFYIFMIVLTFVEKRLAIVTQLFIALVSNFLSVYLAYLLYFVLDDLCVVCVCIYIVNFFCLTETWRIYKLKHGAISAKTSGKTNWHKTFGFKND
ncbi:vitamin K epoxide reductase complex subunit 1 [Teleopsis dalmanni]|uniref:vitamin K epoxide reductase complex subunit 1 n=1 Tax=Teleopsis dalmanni TaxID=139649 RepID=UPI0018CCA4F4|nr:vitamin K epoxide reductase complex subunit 1 [Teleopsis dalmanni]